MAVGHREELLAAAKRCLYEQGYARTTARDLVAASGTNLASIGYHYGSKDNLMNQAMISAVGDWSDELNSVLTGVDLTADTPLARFEAIWTLILGTFEVHRPLWVATFEIYPQIEHVPEVKQVIAEALERGRHGLATLFLGLTEPAPAHLARSVGSLYSALLSGVISQWLVDPAHAPSARELAEGMQIIAAGMVVANSRPKSVRRRS